MSEKDFIGGAEQESRIARHSPVIPPGPIGPEKSDEVARAFVDRCKVRGLSMSERTARLPAAVGALEDVSAFCDDGRRDALPCEKREALCRAIAEWLEQDGRAHELRKPAGLVQLLPGKRLVGLTWRTGQMACIGLATAEQGVGATTTCRAIAAGGFPIIPSAVAVEVDGDTCKDGPLRAALYRAASQGRSATVRRPTLRLLAEKLRGVTVLIDNAHRCKPGALSALVSLNESGVPIVLVAEPELERRLADDLDPVMRALDARCGLRVELLPSELAGGGDGSHRGAAAWAGIDELRSIFSLPKIKLANDALRLLLAIALYERGRLHRCRHYVQVAAAAVRAAGRDTIGEGDLRAAGAVVGGRRHSTAAAVVEARAAAAAG
ncbi:MAG: ATP-binding protein [Phycisphaerales bacterium]|nr:ATP-binding protein [Phycisphaerales bacterium]